jgi:hypothetical protein
MEAFAVLCSRVADTKSTTGACRLMLATSSCMKAPCRLMLRAYTQRRLQANLDKGHMHVQTEALAFKSCQEAQAHANRRSCTQVLTIGARAYTHRSKQRLLLSSLDEWGARIHTDALAVKS